jgi:hypothetical protein
LLPFGTVTVKEGVNEALLPLTAATAWIPQGWDVGMEVRVGV